MYYLTKKSGKWDKQSQEILDNAKDGDWKFDNSKRRSNEQNSFIHAVLFPLIRDWWNDNKLEKDPTVSIDDIKDCIKWHKDFNLDIQYDNSKLNINHVIQSGFKC